jgi:hypothetical protein
MAGLLSDAFLQMFTVLSVFLFGIPVVFRIVHLLRVQIQRLILAVEGRPMGGKQ